MQVSSITKSILSPSPENCLPVEIVQLPMEAMVWCTFICQSVHPDVCQHFRAGEGNKSEPRLNYLPVLVLQCPISPAAATMRSMKG